MTVCVAAICRWGTGWLVVGASDRMLTAGDIEFEPPQTKIYTFDLHIVGLISGDGATQVSIGDRVLARLRAGAIGSTVEGVADAFAEEWRKLRAEEAEARILAPLGLTKDTFLQRQHEFLPEVAQDITRDLQHRPRSGDQTIITGVDPNGSAHIFVVSEPGRNTGHDIVGFAAVGAGEWHAQSQFMLNAYTRQWPFDRAVFLTYLAKRRAEVAPGVGKQSTDLFFIELKTGLNYITAEPLEKIRNTYGLVEQGVGYLQDWAYGEINAFMNALATKGQPQGATSTAEGAGAAPDGGGVPKDPAKGQHEG